MVKNFRSIYKRFIDLSKKKNIANGITSKKLCLSSTDEMHHIIPKVLGGNNNFENLVVLSHDDHIYAHILLNLALHQEQNHVLLDKLNYHCHHISFDLFKSKHVIKQLKLNVFVMGKKHPPIPMTLFEATKHLMFVNRQYTSNQNLLHNMMLKVFDAAMFSRTLYGYKLKLQT